MGAPPVKLVTATPADRARISRLRPRRGTAHFVHYNWFWFDRAMADPAVCFMLARAGARGKLVGCLAFGLHERVDLDPSSRLPDVGEIYHIVIDRSSQGLGVGAA